MPKCSFLLYLPFAALSIFCSAEPSSAQGRQIALLIGAGAYKNIPPLANAKNDASAMAEALRRIGYDVELALDPDRAGLEAAIRRLAERSASADTALFYYAGHALEVGGRNWMLPTSANIHSALDLRFEAFDIDSVVEQLSARARVALVFVDACRDNPFRARLGGANRDLGTRGLARMEAAVGTLIAFATAPGMVAADGAGGNSPFTTALLRHIEKPGLEIRQLIAQVRREVREATSGRQIPWENSALEGEFYFQPPRPAPTSPSSAAATRDLDALFWESVRDSNNAADMRAYLGRFPNGVFAELARSRLARLESSAPVRPIPSRPETSLTSSPRVSPALDGPALQRALASSFAVLTPKVPLDRRESRAKDYQEAKVHKAQAVAPNAGGTWRRTNQESSAAAEERALEGCQLRYGEPCVLIAVNDRMTEAARTRAASDMPRVRYSSHFDAQRIPVITPMIRARADVKEYSAATGPKAIAIHPSGHVFVRTAARDQRTAEGEALKACNDDPQRRGQDGPCFLYAAGNRVVISMRLLQPRPPAKTIEEAMAFMGLRRTAEQYARERTHKALALQPDSGRTFRWGGGSSPQLAERHALEACQLSYGLPCVLVASDGRLRAEDPLAAERHDMPRLRYSGTFRIDMIPFLIDSRRKAAEDYTELVGPKAMAIRPLRTRLATATGKSEAEAEALALAACNEPESASPCFLYAVNDKVVLPLRRTEASQ